MTDGHPERHDLPAAEFADDDGSADPALEHALSAYGQGVATGGDVLDALVATRLLVPVVAVLESSALNAAGLRVDKESSMATVTVRRPDGGSSLLAFTSMAALARWRADARPVPVPARRAAQAALSEGADTLLLDVAGPSAFAVGGAELRVLAFAEDVRLAPHEDPDVASAISAHVTNEPAVAAVLLAPSDAGLRVTFVVERSIGADRFRALVPRLSERLAADLLLRSRVTGGLQLTVVPPGKEPPESVVVYRRA
ncbi:MAG: SseB family protein [Actinomycetes bacterium]